MKGSPQKRVLLLISLVAAMLIMAGCAGSPLRQVDPTTAMKKLSRSALTGDNLSEHTLQVLRQYDLEEAYRENPEKTMYILAMRLHKARPYDRPRDIAFALSELAYLHVFKNHIKGGIARTYLASSARYAYACLFDPSLGPPLSDFDPRYRLAADFYNQSLAQLARLWRERKYDSSWAKRKVRLILGSVTLEVPKPLKKYGPYLKKVQLAFDYEIVGFPNRRRRFGLGVPLMIPVPQKKRAMDKTIHRVSVRPGSFFVDFSGSARDLKTMASIRIYDPVETPYITVKGRRVPLQADLTAPLAYILEKGEKYRGLLSLFRLLSGNTIAAKRGLYLFQPYSPNRIPVVMVHGLMSSPLTWLPMFNELLADPEISQIYQFWFFAYPTGNPILVSAQELRKALYLAQKEFDPRGDNFYFNHMVVVGHSMGGILTRLMISTSDGSLWPELNQKDPYVRSLVQFKPVPFISRVIFMATPHRGAIMAESWIGRLGVRLISFPNYLLRTFTSPVHSIGIPLRLIPTGIENLAPNSPFIKRSMQLPMAPVPFHSIIGNKKGAGIPCCSDGVVPYTSSHLDGAQSELIVKSGHSVQTKPQAIEEVRRILLLHARKLGILDGAQAGKASPTPFYK